MSVNLFSIKPSTGLGGPPPREEGSDPSAVGVVTGGGLMAVVESARGVRSLFRGEERLSSGIEVGLDGLLLPAGAELRQRGGSWERRVPLGSEEVVIERGLLSDVASALVIQWSLISHGEFAGSPLEGSFAQSPRRLSVAVGGAPGDGSNIDLPLAPNSPATLLIVPEGVGFGPTSELLRSLRGRELQREARSIADPGALRIILDGEPVRAVDGALQSIDDSPLSVRDGGPLPPFLGGVEGAAPTYLEGANLAEVGLGALLSGKRTLARRILDALSEESAPPPLPFLHLAARWALWTGDPRGLLPLREQLDRAVAKVGSATSPASLPPAQVVLKDLLDGIERLGDEEWNRSLRTHIERLAAAVQAPRRRTLPILGIASDPDLTPRGKAGLETRGDPLLPDPDSFASPDHPGLRSRRTLQGARILRSWVEGVLGARPDAGYGRFRIAPSIRSGWESLEVRGIGAGDALLTFICARDPGGYLFTFRQESGRVPVNLIFEPFLPLSEVMEVQIDGETATVDIEIETGGTRLRCQLPLDGERVIGVRGVTSGTSSSLS